MHSNRTPTANTQCQVGFLPYSIVCPTVIDGKWYLRQMATRRVSRPGMRGRLHFFSLSRHDRNYSKLARATCIRCMSADSEFAFDHSGEQYGNGAGMHPICVCVFARLRKCSTSFPDTYIHLSNCVHFLSINQTHILRAADIRSACGQMTMAPSLVLEHIVGHKSNITIDIIRGRCMRQIDGHIRHRAHEAHTHTHTHICINIEWHRVHFRWTWEMSALWIRKIKKLQTFSKRGCVRNGWIEFSDDTDDD